MGLCAPYIFEFIRKLVKILPGYKSVGHSIFCDLFFSNNLVTIVGQLVRTPPPTKGVLKHPCFEHKIIPIFLGDKRKKM